MFVNAVRVRVIININVMSIITQERKENNTRDVKCTDITMHEVRCDNDEVQNEVR